MKVRKPRSSLGIVIPAYNEEKRIGKTLESYLAFFDKKSKVEGFDYQILVVINNTHDRTEEIVKKYAKKNKHISYLNLPKGGKGYAVTKGFEELLKGNADPIGFVDADLATPPEAFYDLFVNLRSSDGVLASRYLKGSKLTPALNFRRLFVARIFNFIVRSLFLMPYKDTQCGAKLFRKKALQATLPHLGMTQWAFDVELLYELNRRGFRVKDIQTTWYDIEGSKLHVIKTSLQMLFSILQLRVIKSPFRRLLRPLKPIVLALWKRVH